MNTVEYLKMEGKAEGKEEGLAEGFAKGQAEERRYPQCAGILRQ